jgi:hypothetical protein
MLYCLLSTRGAGGRKRVILGSMRMHYKQDTRGLSTSERFVRARESPKAYRGGGTTTSAVPTMLVRRLFRTSFFYGARCSASASLSERKFREVGGTAVRRVKHAQSGSSSTAGVLAAELSVRCSADR